MPRWVQLSREPEPPALPALEAATFPWLPELRFAAHVRNPQQLDVLRRVQEFLAAGGRARCMVPVKERSVELFGDEKKLDELRGSALFRSGRLSLEMLRCFQVNPPLVWERGPSPEPRPIIIIENHSTWHSFARWNQTHGAWAAVCYGSGVCFESSAPSLADVIRQVPWSGALLYFGDLDPAGLLIPGRANAALHGAGLPPVVPAREFYELILHRAGHIALAGGEPLHLADGAVAWLGDELSLVLREWFARGVRIPQELAGYEQLHARPA
jgi:hypothetical protein